METKLGVHLENKDTVLLVKTNKENRHVKSKYDKNFFRYQVMHITAANTPGCNTKLFYVERLIDKKSYVSRCVS